MNRRNNVFRKYFNKYVPKREKIAEYKSLHWIGMHRDALWRLNRHSVARSVALGLFCAMLPLPFQTVLAATLALIVHANLPVTIAFVWVTNPITIPFVWYIQYQIGVRLLGISTRNTDENWMSWHMVLEHSDHIGKPLLLGAVISASTLALLGYVATHRLWIASVRRIKRKSQLS